MRPEQKLPLLTGLNEKVFAADKRIRKVNVSFGDEAGAILIADSNGRIVEDLQPMTRLYLSCVAEQDGQEGEERLQRRRPRRHRLLLAGEARPHGAGRPSPGR